MAATGEVIIDASTGTPTYRMHFDIVGVQALPLLTSTRVFDKIDGKMQAKIAAWLGRRNQHAIMANVGGTVFVDLPGRQPPRVERRPDDPFADREHALERLAATAGTGDRPDAALGVVQDRPRTGRHHSISIWCGPLVKVTGVGTIDLSAPSMIGLPRRTDSS